MGKERFFRFKQFEVRHKQSALPVGMDGVLLGAWADVSNTRTILDAGTGCGVIALMCAQRNPIANITAIDIHLPSVEEANYNFAISRWRDRLHAECTDFMSIPTQISRNFDLIISNPPFFDAGVTAIDTNPRLAARHSGVLGPEQLIKHGYNLLSDSGSIALISPATQKERLISLCSQHGMSVTRLCNVVSKPGKEPKRILLQAEKLNQPLPSPTHYESTIFIYDKWGDYSCEYRFLTRDFYLKF